MADRPILFGGPMVRALLADTKTETRRTLNPQPMQNSAGLWTWSRPGVSVQGEGLELALAQRIGVGDRLWVREAWTLHDRAGDVGTVAYQATFKSHGWTETIQQFPRDLTLATRVQPVQRGWRPSIHMPRWASRLTLTVTDVKVERLQDISETDARAEGVQFEAKPIYPGAQCYFVEIGGGEVVSGWDARDCYGELWDHINGAGKWNANPWVAAYTFTVERGNIDRIGGQS